MFPSLPSSLKSIKISSGEDKKKMHMHCLAAVRTWVICFLLWSLVLLSAQFFILHRGRREGVGKPKAALKPGKSCLSITANC